MVNVTHDRHHRGTGHERRVALRHFVVCERFRIVQSSNDRFVTQFFHQNHGSVLVQGLIDRDHLAQLHQLLDNL